MNRRNFKNIISYAFLMVFLAGCASSGSDSVEVTEKNEAEDLMKSGLEAFDEKYYTSARESFQKIIDRYPYSQHRFDAELKLADAFYYEKEYESAFDAYNEFQRLHPKNPKIPYVIFQKGMCRYNRTSTVDRDQSNTLMAKDEFERLVNSFPDTEYAGRALWKMRECYILMARAELAIGHFYFKMKKYEAAMGRYRYVLENHPDLGQYHEAIESLTKCREKLSQLETQKDVSEDQS